MQLKHSRYINPLLDFSFKKIFGSDPNKDLLIDFLDEKVELKAGIMTSRKSIL